MTGGFDSTSAKNALWRLNELAGEEIARSGIDAAARPRRRSDHIELRHRRDIARPAEKRAAEEILVEMVAARHAIAPDKVGVLALDLLGRLGRACENTGAQ